jgi:sporulation protein YlmC with PRC-barrel domain
MKIKLSEFQYAEVVREDGTFLGHVFDLRSLGEPEHGITHDARAVDELVYGRMGLFARLGLDEADATTLPWSAVKEMRDGVIVVSNDVEPSE